MPITIEELAEWPTAVLELCRLAWADLEPRPSPYNPLGQRAFGIYVTEEDVDRLENDGVRIRMATEPFVVVALGSGSPIPEDIPDNPFNVEVYLYKWEYQDRKGTKLYFKKFV